MKYFVFVTIAWSFVAVAKTEKIDGVPFKCVDAVRFELIRQYGQENKEDREAIAYYHDLISGAPAYACRTRANRNVEILGWCDGSGCSGAVGTLSMGKCNISDVWYGQDDGEAIDQEQFAKDCLLKSDFRK